MTSFLCKYSAKPEAAGRIRACPTLSLTGTERREQTRCGKYNIYTHIFQGHKVKNENFLPNISIM